MDRTREKLIEAAVDLVAHSEEELTIRRVAAHANVSVPTAYRYFPDREELLKELAAWINARIAGAKVPENLEEAAAWVEHIYRAFEQNDKFMRAQLNTPEGRAIRERNRKSRNVMLRSMVAASFPSASETTTRRLGALIQLLVTVPGWVSLHDNWGMSGDEAGRVTAWAVTTLVDKLRSDLTTLEFDTAAPAATEPAPAASAPKSKRKSRAKG